MFPSHYKELCRLPSSDCHTLDSSRSPLPAFSLPRMDVNEVASFSLCSRSTVAFVAALGTLALLLYGPGAATAPPAMQQQPQPPQRRGGAPFARLRDAQSELKHAHTRPHARHKHVAARTQPLNSDVFSEEESAVIRKAAEDPTSMFDMSTP